MFNPKKIKKDFPIFQNNPDLVFLDSAASSQKPRSVIDAVSEVYEEYYANVNRGIYELSEKSTQGLEEAREKVAKFINALSPEEIIFTRNATESINLVAYTWARQNIKNGDKILINLMEHHANIVPWQMLKGKVTGNYVTLTSPQSPPYKGGDAKLEVIGLTDDYRLDMEDYKKKLDSGDVKLVAITHQSNVLGTINPVKKIVELAHERDIKVLIDGAQAVPHMPVDVQDLDADFYVFSGHKMLGPSGVGVLYAKKALLEGMPPMLGGGGMIKDVTFEKTIFNVLPQKFEAGTPNIAGAIGLGAAVDYLTELGMDNVFKHEQKLTNYALTKLRRIDGVKIFGPTHPLPDIVGETPLNRGDLNNSPLERGGRAPIVSGRGRGVFFRGGAIAFTLGEAHPHDLATIFDEEKVAIRAGHHCAMPLHKHLSLPATARASFYIYNDKADVDKLINAIIKAQEIFT